MKRQHLHFYCHFEVCLLVTLKGSELLQKRRGRKRRMTAWSPQNTSIPDKCSSYRSWYWSPWMASFILWIAQLLHKDVVAFLNADRNSLICSQAYQYTKDGIHSWLPISITCLIDSLKCQTQLLFTNMLHCKAPMHRKRTSQFTSFLLKHFGWKMKSAVSNSHGFLLMFTVQFYPERTEHGFVECSDFSALAEI